MGDVFLKWDDSFSIGVPEIDRQHKMLFDLTNEVAKAAAEGTGLDGPLNSLVEYVKIHFAVEEDLMARSRFPGLDTHRKIHAELAAKVTGMVGRLLEGSPFRRRAFVFFVGLAQKPHKGVGQGVCGSAEGCRLRHGRMGEGRQRGDGKGRREKKLVAGLF